jgi:hypothetical protein
MRFLIIFWTTSQMLLSTTGRDGTVGTSRMRMVYFNTQSLIGLFPARGFVQRLS